MSDTVIYPYVHDNRTNLNPDKNPYWTYCVVPADRTYSGGNRYVMNLAEYHAHTLAHPIVIDSVNTGVFTYVNFVVWHTSKGT